MADILNEAIKLQTLLEQYDSKTYSGFNAMLEKTLDKIIAKLNRMGTDVGRARLNAMLAETVKLIQEQYVGFNGWLQEDQRAIAEIAYNTSSAAYQSALASGVATFSKLPESAVKRILDPNRYILGNTIKDYETGLTNKQIQDFKQIIANGVSTGDNTETITKALIEQGEVLKRHARTIANTAISSATSESYNESAKQFESVIVAYFSESVLDSRTSNICKFYAGKIWRRKKDESYDSFISRIPKDAWTPRHPNERTVMLALTEEQIKLLSEIDKPAIVDADKKTINHRDGTTGTVYKNKKVKFVKADTTYYDFFEKQSDKFKESVLGKARFKLYKEGRLKISQVIDIRTKDYKSIEQINKIMDD